MVVQGHWLKDAVCHRAKKDISKKILVSQTDVTIPDNMNVRYSQSQMVTSNKFFYPVAPSAFKNHECIFEAVDILVSKGITDFEVLLTIDNDDGQYPEKSQIAYLGKQTRERVLEILCDSVLVFPSYIETYGLPMAEARAVGCVTIASDCPFSHELLDDYANAYFFDPFQSEQLATYMERIISGSMPYKQQLRLQTTRITWDDIMAAFHEIITHNPTFF